MTGQAVPCDHRWVGGAAPGPGDGNLPGSPSVVTCASGVAEPAPTDAANGIPNDVRTQ